MTDYDKIPYQKLKTIASSRGINTHRKRHEELANELRELDNKK